MGAHVDVCRGEPYEGLGWCNKGAGLWIMWLACGGGICTSGGAWYCAAANMSVGEGETDLVMGMGTLRVVSLTTTGTSRVRRRLEEDVSLRSWERDSA